MSDNQEHINTIQDIRNLMEKSTRFISLSGMAGVFAGVYALGGALAFYLKFHSISYEQILINVDSKQLFNFLLPVGLLVVFLSLATALILSLRKQNGSKMQLFNVAARRLLLNLMIPLISGGLFVLFLMLQGYYKILPPSLLVFYGLALIHGSKYTLEDIRYLGYFEVVIGLLNLYTQNYSLIFWCLGFGALHIIYGLIMWNKYDRKQ